MKVDYPFKVHALTVHRLAVVLKGRSSLDVQAWIYQPGCSKRSYQLGCTMACIHRSWNTITNVVDSEPQTEMFGQTLFV